MANSLLVKYIGVALLLLTGFAGGAQQLNTSSFYELNFLLHNPAATGSRQHALFGTSFKKQWSGMPGSPQTGVAYGQGYIATARLGLGGYLYNDITGPTSRNGVQMAYAYHIPLKEKTTLSFGLEARLQQLRFDRAKLMAELGGIDPVSLNISNRFRADAGFGMAYNSPTLQVGASVSQLVQTKYRLYEVTGTSSAQSRLYRHYYFHGAYVWKTDEDIRVIPNILFIYLPNAPLELQGGVRLVNNDLLWYGMHWRARQGWMISAGINLKKKFSIGYSFDIYRSPLSIYEKGSLGHELLLHYELR